MVWQRGFLLSSSSSTSSSSTSSKQKRQINKKNVTINSSIDCSLDKKSTKTVNDDIQCNTRKNAVSNQQGNTSIQQSTVLLDIESDNSLSNTTTLLNTLLPNITTTSDKEIQEQNDDKNTSRSSFLLQIGNTVDDDNTETTRNQDDMNHFDTKVMIQEVESHTTLSNVVNHWNYRVDTQLNPIDQSSALALPITESESVSHRSIVHDSQQEHEMSVHDHMNRLILHLRHTKHRMWQSVVLSNDSSSLSLLPLLKTEHNRRCIWVFLFQSILQFNKHTTTSSSKNTNIMKSIEMWLCRFLLWNYWETNHSIDDVIVSILHNPSTETNESFQSKQQQLILVTVLDVWYDDIERKCIKKCTDIDDELFASLLDILIPNLVTTIDSIDEARTTVLMHRMMYLVYRTFALASQYIVHSRNNTSTSTTISIPANSTLMMISKQSNLLVHVFKKHIDQIQKRYSDIKNEPRKVSLMKKQKQDCILVVIQDWIHTYHMCQEQHRIHTDNNQQWTYIWCQRLTSHQSPMHFGSITQSLFSSSSCEFSHVVDAVTSVQMETIKQSTDQFYIIHDIVRGLVAFLGHRISNTYRKFPVHRKDMLTILDWLFCNLLTDIRCGRQAELLGRMTMYDCV